MNQQVDSNNNAEEIKYSLRPRTACKRTIGVLDQDDSKESCLEQGKKTRKGSRPLSKYRRRSANARERSRMREINKAFETLRRVVSGTSAVNHQGEKMTKISTLRLAMKYITALSNALEAESDPDELTFTRESLSNHLPTALRDLQSSSSFPSVSGHESSQHLTTPSELILSDFKLVRSYTLNSPRYQHLFDEQLVSLTTELPTTGCFPRSTTSEQPVDTPRTLNVKFGSLYRSSRSRNVSQVSTNSSNLSSLSQFAGGSNMFVGPHHEKYDDIKSISRIENQSLHEELDPHQELEDCSSRLSPNTQSLPFQAIFLDELLSTR